MQAKLEAASLKVRRCVEKKESLKIREARLRGSAERAKCSVREELQNHQACIQLAGSAKAGLLAASEIVSQNQPKVLSTVESACSTWHSKAVDGVVELGRMRAEFFRGEVQRFHSAEQIVDFHADSLEEASKEGAKSQAFNDQAAALQEADRWGTRGKAPCSHTFEAAAGTAAIPSIGSSSSVAASGAVPAGRLWALPLPAVWDKAPALLCGALPEEGIAGGCFAH